MMLLQHKWLQLTFQFCHQNRMTSCHGISTSQPPKIVDSVVFDMVQAQLSFVVAIPLRKVMLEAAPSSWSKPSLVPISTKRLDHMYQTQEESVSFLLSRLS